MFAAMSKYCLIWKEFIDPHVFDEVKVAVIGLLFLQTDTNINNVFYNNTVINFCLSTCMMDVLFICSI